MRPFFQLAVWLAVLAAAFASPARAQDSSAYVVTYVELMPNEIASGASLLNHYRDASKREPGNLRFDVLHEIARPSRFAIIETWNDKAARDAHDQAAATAQFRARLKSIEDAPDDERIVNPLYSTPAKTPAQSAAIYVVTHVDVIPPGKDDCMTALKAMSLDTAKDSGNIAYQVLVQAGRSNHFTVLEAWNSKAALDAHAMAAHTRSFREKLSPLAGALYDERLYTKLE
ncbi:MAG: antibiotic biosynthesis monooxygenase [Xanthobacteraceae bacterium]|jgi:quinol monooxygenase YgiN